MDKIKPNMTVSTVATKNRSKLPVELGMAFDSVNTVINKLNKLKRIPDIIKAAQLSKVVREQLESASSSLVAYRADLEAQKLEFEKTIIDLSKPNGQHEMMEHLSLRTELLSGNQMLRDMVYSDPTVSKVAYRLPDQVKKKMNLKDNVLLEAIFEGYNGEIQRYDDLLANVDRAEQHLIKEFNALIDEDAEANISALQGVG